MSDIEYRVTFLTGVKELKPVEYRITSAQVGPWWWRRTKFWLETEFMRMGPFNTKSEANVMLSYARWYG